MSVTYRFGAGHEAGFECESNGERRNDIQLCETDSASGDSHGSHGLRGERHVLTDA